MANLAKVLFFTNLVFGVINLSLGNTAIGLVNFVAAGMTFNNAFEVKS